MVLIDLFAFFPSQSAAPTAPPRGGAKGRRFGDSLPTVVPAGWQALSCPPTGALPRNRLASSATGGASAILCPPSCQPVGRHCRARRPGHFLEIASLHPPQAALRRFSAHRRASRLAGTVVPADRGTSSKSPRFIRHRRRFGDFPAVYSPISSSRRRRLVRASPVRCSLE